MEEEPNVTDEELEVAMGENRYQKEEEQHTVERGDPTGCEKVAQGVPEAPKD